MATAERTTKQVQAEIGGGRDRQRAEFNDAAPHFSAIRIMTDYGMNSLVEVSWGHMRLNLLHLRMVDSLDLAGHLPVTQMTSASV